MKPSMRTIFRLLLICALFIPTQACSTVSEVVSTAVSGVSQLVSGRSQPKAGHWQGSNPSVSFEVTEDGQITNFVLSAPFVNSTCRLNIIKINVDGSEFLFDAKSGDQQTATLYIFTLKGAFSSETISGTYEIKTCGRTIALQPQEMPWKAAWRDSTAATAPPSPVAPTAVIQPSLPAATKTLTPEIKKSVYLGDYQPTTATLGYGKYSVGSFTFSSEDEGDDIHIGDPIIFGGVEYPHGIFAHAPSRLVYNLGSHAFTELSATLGMIEKIRCGDGVFFIVQADGAEIYRSKLRFPWSDPVEITVPVARVRELVLLVDTGGNDNLDCDWAVWGDPVLR